MTVAVADDEAVKEDDGVEPSVSDAVAVPVSVLPNDGEYVYPSDGDVVIDLVFEVLRDKLGVKEPVCVKDGVCVRDPVCELVTVDAEVAELELDEVADRVDVAVNEIDTVVVGVFELDGLRGGVAEMDPVRDCVAVPVCDLVIVCVGVSDCEIETDAVLVSDGVLQRKKRRWGGGGGGGGGGGR